MKNIYEQPYQLVKEEFLNGLDFITNTTGQPLLNHLANINNDIEFLIDCHNIISHQWRYKIHLQSRKVINDHTKWIVFYDGSLLHNAIIDDNKKIWLSNTDKFKIGDPKRHMHKVFDVDTDYFLFYKILGKYLFIEKQGLDNQIWTKEYREMIIKLKTAEFERDNYKRLLDAKDN
jgi:hypothetical protein